MQDVWQYSTVHNSACKVIEEHTLWGQTVCRVWLPNQDAVVRVPRSALRPLSADLQPEIEAGRIAYVAAAAKVAEVLEGSTSATDGHVLLAPMESNVIPLPHQIHALSRAISGDRVRYLLADEVGLGKTIEAGLVMRELKLRGLVRRTLVVAPKSLALQWQAEMENHFNESFILVNAADLEAYERLMPGSLPEHQRNPWLNFPQAIITTDAFKPLSKRRGWNKETVQRYNLIRHERLITAQWDLIIIDEAHRLGGVSDLVARYRLGQGLAEAAPYLLLLSATPHQGKSGAFARLMGLLDPMSFPDVDSIKRDRVAPFVIRTEKRKAVTSKGEPLFKPRTTRTLTVDLENFPDQLKLYNEVTDYAKFGYNLALHNRSPFIAFLMILLQRIASSSTRAIRWTLERRLERLDALKDDQRSDVELIIEDLEELTGQELLNELLDVNEPGRVNEVAQVRYLLSLAQQVEASGPDAKALRLIELIYQLQGEESDDQLKLLIFTEFVGTQLMLQEFLQARGFVCATINGSMEMDERKQEQHRFADEARVMISTDAGGEGLNLQFAHVVINYDLPWNPMRVEQRIGRVDRIGQPKLVRAFNFVFENSIESRVLEVIEEKLLVIFKETGIDKTNDVLDTQLASELYEQMMTHVVMENHEIDTEVERMLSSIERETRAVRDQSPIYAISEEVDLTAAESLRNHPLPDWVEQMTLSYLRLQGGNVVKTPRGWSLTWPDGEVQKHCVFSVHDAEARPEAKLLNLENSRVRGLALNLPQVTAGQPLPCVSVSGLPASISGLWGLFEIRLQAGMHQKTQLLRIPMVRRGYVSVFLSEEGKLFLPTARHIWDALQTAEAQVRATLRQDESITAHERLQIAAEQAGQELFDALQQAHLASVAREEERGIVSFASRRKAIERVGLPEVRQFRLSRCDADESEWRHELQSARQIVPEIRPLLMLRIVKGGAQ
ncbi:helicase-related protein [Nitrosomonas sp.]|uniref:DEAD/DEAH box helicase n=1 Tax=Nitrosomonas sp. TaxID=42353 RepID=UPI0026371D23|nr:helicase-related protein [Nitrosomonas sp.]